MRKSIKILIVTTTSLLFTACGGGGGGGSSSSNTSSGLSTITITDCETYTTLQSGDTVVNDSSNANAKFSHDADGNRQVCMVSGSAHIER